MGEMAVMGRKGDTRVIWNPRDPDEVAAARAQFDTLVKEKRFLAFRVNTTGGKGEQITEFDAEAEKLIIAPPMAGGDDDDVVATVDEICDDLELRIDRAASRLGYDVSAKALMVRVVNECQVRMAP